MEIVKVYEECDCFVLPSAGETFGVVYVEAMAAGLPVIATRCGGPEDFVNEDNGILIISEIKDMHNESIADDKYHRPTSLRYSTKNRIIHIFPYIVYLSAKQAVPVHNFL